MIGNSILNNVRNHIQDFEDSSLKELVDTYGPYVIKFVQSRWAEHYSNSKPLKISVTPALTWGTATYVTPIAFPLSSALYGRIGLVSRYNPVGWKIFDATRPTAVAAYARWVAAQPAYTELVTTVHSTFANHFLRNQFKEIFKIDCIMFHPDQEAEGHTDLLQHIWLAVTDWTSDGKIEMNLSARFNKARFTVLLDEDFNLQENSLPVHKAKRQIESITEQMHMANPNNPLGIGSARVDVKLPGKISTVFNTGGYLHVYIEP